MGRAPCCEKMGLKKGPWTSEEDEILINYIKQNGNGNWRALPKRAGLLRCGKSCRLRWMNYLRPDIKRGNFTAEEEDMIFKLHRELGNKWSIIAAKLPGRTDNEIKNIWHTHLKKKKNKQLNGKSQPEPEPEPETKKQSTDSCELIEKWSEEDSCSPVQSSSEISSITAAAATVTDYLGDFTDMGESFWSEIFSDGDSELKLGNSFASDLDGDDFWGELFCRADDFTHFSFNQHIPFTDV